MNKNNQYLTQPKINQQNNQTAFLRKYVDSIDDKINYAKWKQDLVLTYNYMPLTNVKDKIESDRVNFLQKVEKKQRQFAYQLKNHEVEEQNKIFKEFQAKLKDKMQTIEKLIHKQNMKISILEAQAEEKRMIVRDSVRENMNLGKLVYMKQSEEAQRKLESGPRLIKSHSTKSRLTNLPTVVKNNSSRMSTRMASQSSRVTQYKDLYGQCLDCIIKSLRKMQSSEDIQQGIFLDIMKRKKQKIGAKYSLKSTICDTLMSRYKRSILKPSKNEGDFHMSWDTFKNLNWKQIMGIVLVKDPECIKLQKILQII